MTPRRPTWSADEAPTRRACVVAIALVLPGACLMGCSSPPPDTSSTSSPPASHAPSSATHTSPPTRSVPSTTSAAQGLPAVRFRGDVQPATPPVPPLTPPPLPGARITIGGSWEGTITTATADCNAQYGYVNDDPVGWGYGAGGVGAGQSSVGVSWMNGDRRPTVEIRFYDPDHRGWEAATEPGGESSGGPILYAVSADHRAVTFSGTAVVTPTFIGGGDAVLAKITTISISGSIGCTHMDLR